MYTLNIKKIIIISLISLWITHPVKATVRITCIGASITEGATLRNPAKESYPAQLKAMAGREFLVNNYGVSSATLLRKGDLSYWNTSAYQMALKSNPDIVFIDLGGNDSKLINRVHLKEFKQDYKDLIHSFQQLASHPRIVLLLPIPSFVRDTAQIWDPVIVSRIIPLIRQTAFEEHVEVIDMHSLMISQSLQMPDHIHPDFKGTTILARRLYEVVTQSRDKTFDVFRKIPQTHQISSFYGYDCADFKLNDSECKVVKPKWSAVGHPWIWRARFWGHEPQTDIALLERGFHLVYCDVAELLGNKEAIRKWNDCYALLNQAGLGKKAVLEGMSRGGIYIYNWAAVNPGKVACIYADNALLDLSYWPDSVVLKKDFGLIHASDIAALKESPIDKTALIVKGKYPMLHLLADEDEAVDPEKNTLLFARKIAFLKGKITVIHKPGFKHHPHSLPDPAPIVEFILKATGYYLHPDLKSVSL